MVASSESGFLIPNVGDFYHAFRLGDQVEWKLDSLGEPPVFALC